MIEKPIFCTPVDLGTIATGNEREESPAYHLGIHDSPGLVWRTNGGSNIWARGMMPQATAISFCSMLAANALPVTKIRLRLGSSQAEVNGGSAAYDSGEVDFISPAATRDGRLYHSFDRFDEVEALWWRIDIIDHPNDFEAMGLVLGKAVQTGRFYDRGWEIGARDLGAIDYSRFGVAMEVDGFVGRTVTFKLSWVTEAEFEANFRRLMLLGTRGPVFLCFDPQEVAERQERIYFGRFGQAPFAQSSRKAGNFAMEFAMQSILPEARTTATIYTDYRILAGDEAGDGDFRLLAGDMQG